MKFATKTAAVAAGMFAVTLATGCGAYAATAGRTPQITVRTCAAFGVRAIEHHITVTRRPAQCRGLSQAEVNQAVATAVRRVAGSAPKAVRRRREGEEARYLEDLVTALPPGVSSVPGQSSASASGRDLPMSIAALIAWLVAAGSGGYVLKSWMAHGGTLRDAGSPGAENAGVPPIVIIGHFSLALSGLAVWVAYLITGWSALAWTAVLVLLPVAGLGMSTLFVGFPGRRVGLVAATGTGTEGGTDAGSAGTTTLVGGRDTGTVSVRARLSPLIVFGHGALAVTTMALVLLAALGAAAH